MAVTGRRALPAAVAAQREGPSERSASTIARLWSARWLLAEWSRRDFTVRYRQSAIGLLWVVVQPALLLAIYGVVFVNVLGVESDRGPYVVFAAAGLVPWAFVASALTLAVPSILTAQPIVTKVYFPREVIPLAAVAVSALELLVGTIVLLVLTVGAGEGLHLSTLGVLPLYGGLALLVAGAGVIAAVLTVFARDLRYAVPLLLQVLFIVTPVMYPAELVPERWREVYRLNPVAAVIEGVRAAVIDGRWPSLATIGWVLLAGAVFLWAALRYLRAVEHRFADVG